MRVDFYQLSQSSVEVALPQLAAKMRDAAARVLIVSADQRQRERIGAALWAVKDHFLAHGEAGADYDSRQPILLSEQISPVNGATFLVLADGQWREGADGFERVFLLFDGSTIDDARATWRRLGEASEMERHYWRQEAGSWVKAA